MAEVIRLTLAMAVIGNNTKKKLAFFGGVYGTFLGYLVSCGHNGNDASVDTLKITHCKPIIEKPVHVSQRIQMQ